MKGNIDFYQHFANADQHPKFKMLRVQFGWAGEGKFWALNNRIAQSEDCCLDISKKYNKAAIASDLDFNLDELDKFITFLLEDCELITECSEGLITTGIVQENFERVRANREAARMRKQRSLEKVLKGSGERSKSSGEPLRENADQNKKVKESKSKGKEKEDLPDSIESGSQEFYLTRKKKKLTGKRLESFETFWDAFGLKKDKASAADSWLDIPTLNNQLLETIIEAAKIEAMNRPDLIRNGTTPKWAQGWLTARRWEDEPTKQPVQYTARQGNDRDQNNKQACAEFMNTMMQRSDYEE